MTQSALAWAALSLYLAAAVDGFRYLFAKSEDISRRMFGFLGFGLALHAGSIIAHLAGFWIFPENRWFFPLTSFYGTLSYMSWALAAAFFIVEARAHLGILGAFVLPAVAVSLGAAVLFGRPVAAPLTADLRSYWLNLHPVFLMTAYAAFANAFGVGIAFLVQERQIKSRKPSEVCYRLPSLDELDVLNGHIILAAFPILLAGLVMGFIWAERSWGGNWMWDPKLLSAILTAMVYGAYLWIRFGAGRRGRRPVILSLFAFAFILLTFFGAEFFAGRHSFMGSGH